MGILGLSLDHTYPAAEGDPAYLVFYMKTVRLCTFFGLGLGRVHEVAGPDLLL